MDKIKRAQKKRRLEPVLQRRPAHPSLAPNAAESLRAPRRIQYHQDSWRKLNHSRREEEQITAVNTPEEFIIVGNGLRSQNEKAKYSIDSEVIEATKVSYNADYLAILLF